VFGISDKQILDFRHIHQRWLRDAATGYVIERLATRKTLTAYRDLQWLAHLSDYLQTRADRQPRLRTAVWISPGTTHAQRKRIRTTRVRSRRSLVFPLTMRVLPSSVR